MRTNLASGLNNTLRYGEIEGVIRTGPWRRSRSWSRTSPKPPNIGPCLPDRSCSAAHALTGLDKYGEAEGPLRRAREILEQLVADYPDKVDYLRELEVFYMNSFVVLLVRPDARHRDPVRALELARLSLEVFPGEQLRWKMLCWKWLAVAEYLNGHWDAAIKASEKCIELQGGGSGGWAFNWLVLALAHARRGEMDKAREWYEKARPTVEEWKDADQKNPVLDGRRGGVPFRRETP